MKLRNVLLITVVVLLLGGVSVWAYETLIYIEQGGSKMVVASGGELELQSGAIFDSQGMIGIAVPTAQGTATPGLYITNSSVAASIHVAEGESNFQEVDMVFGVVTAPTAQATNVPALKINQAGVGLALDVQTGNAAITEDLDVDGTTNLDVVDVDSYVDIAIPTAQATGVPGLNITNSSVAASLVVDGGETSVDELDADFIVVVAPTAQATGVPGISIDNNGVGLGLHVTDGGATFDEAVTMGSSLDVQGGNITLQNDEVIDNSADATIAFTDGTNTLFSIVDAGTTGNGDFSGTLTVDGISTLTGAVAANGGITVDSTAFTVADTTGNVATTGTLGVTGLSTLSGGESIPYGVENLRQTSVFSNTVAQTGAGGTVVLATVEVGEIWVVHDILVHCTTEYDDTAGDDEAIEIGTGEDEDGFCVLGTAELIPTYAAATGFAEGWSCNSVQDRGVFFDEAATNSWVGGFIIESTETIDVKVSSGAGDDITQGSIDVYVIYTRLE